MRSQIFLRDSSSRASVILSLKCCQEQEDEDDEPKETDVQMRGNNGEVFKEQAEAEEYSLDKKDEKHQADEQQFPMFVFSIALQ